MTNSDTMQVRVEGRLYHDGAWRIRGNVITTTRANAADLVALHFATYLPENKAEHNEEPEHLQAQPTLQRLQRRRYQRRDHSAEE